MSNLRNNIFNPYCISTREASYMDGDFTEYHLCIVERDSAGKKQYSPTGIKADSVDELRQLSDGLQKALKKPILRH